MILKPLNLKPFTPWLHLEIQQETDMVTKGSTATVQYPLGISLMSCQQCEPTMSIVQGLKSS